MQPIALYTQFIRLQPAFAIACVLIAGGTSCTSRQTTSSTPTPLAETSLPERLPELPTEPHAEPSAEPNAEPNAEPRAAFQPTSIDEITARALRRSLRVQERKALLDAIRSDVDALCLPPDPSLALSLGLPVDGVDGDAFSISLMSGIGWLLQRDALRAEADALLAARAQDLLASSIETAADARHLTRVVIATSEAALAAERRKVAEAASLHALEVAAAVGEVRSEMVAAAKSSYLGAAREHRRREEAHMRARAQLASLLQISEPLLDLTKISRQSLEAMRDLHDSPYRDSPAVFAARARWTEAQRELQATQSIFSLDEGVGAGFSRDLEGRESINAMLTIQLPLFRQTYEIAAQQARVQAAEFAVREAQRMRTLERTELLLQRDSAVAQYGYAQEALAYSRAMLQAMEAAVDAGELAPQELRSAQSKFAMQQYEALDAAIAASAAHAAYERLFSAEIASLQVSRIDSNNTHPSWSDDTIGVTP